MLSRLLLSTTVEIIDWLESTKYIKVLEIGYRDRGDISLCCIIFDRAISIDDDLPLDTTILVWAERECDNSGVFTVNAAPTQEVWL